MKYYDARKPLYLETDASGVGLAATPLQVRDNLDCGYDETPEIAMLQPIVFASKSLSSAECKCSNIGREEPRMLHGVEKFLHYDFAHEVHVITDKEPLVAIMGKNVAALSQGLQSTVPCIHQ